MPAVRPPTFWLWTAAATISTVAVVTMVVSGNPRKPLAFAGAILRPDTHSSAGSLAPATNAHRPSASPSPTPATAAAPAPAAPGGNPPAVASLLPASATRGTVTGLPAATTHGPAAAGAPAPAPSSHTPQPHTSVPAAPQSAGWSSAAFARALFTDLNKARRQAGLAPLTWSTRLQRSAAGHDQAMAQANQLSPRVGDEPSLGVRQANQGVLGSYAAEILGSTDTTSSAAAQAVQQAMLAEQPPDDSHRQILLSSALDTVGIDVLIDPAHGRLWITEDFAQLH